MDRLAELKKNKPSFEIDVQDESVARPSNAKEFGVGGAKEGSMEEFFKIIEIVKKSILNIKEVTKEIVEINQKLVLATTEAQEDNASEGLQQIIVTGNKNARTAQGLLKDLNKEVLEVEKRNSIPASELRIRKNLVQTLTKKYIDVLKEYQNSQNKSKEVRKKRAVKRVQQVKPDATQEEIEVILYPFIPLC
jgi:syntaxin 1B/2/3